MLTLPQRLFDSIQLPDDFLDRMEALAQRGPIVYVLRNRSVPDLLALHSILRRGSLPRLGYTHDVHLGLLDPNTPSIFPRITRKRPEADALERALVRRESALLFLKRPPHIRDVVSGKGGSRGLREGDDLLGRLLRLQTQMEQPIQLVPVVFVWTSSADTHGATGLDMLMGPREWPSTLRSVFQVLANYRNGEMRMGAPLSVSEYIADQGALPSDTLVRRLVYLLLSRVERERRSVTGPAYLPPDLLRQRVLRTPQLQAVIRRMAGDSDKDRIALARKADEILQEMQSLPNGATLRAMRMFLDRLFGRLYASVDVDKAGIRRLQEYAKEGTLVLLPSHKSHMDSLVVSYVFYIHHLGMPLIAAGDNLAFFPLGQVARRSGAFFIRRSFKGDRLYAATVEAYLRRLLRDGHTLEVFLEGGRSRTGKLLKPQIGLLSILVSAALHMERRPVYFVPISIGYERLIEAQSFQNENLGQEKEKEDAAALLRSTELFTGRYGRVDVQFGEALTLDDMRRALELPQEGELSPAKRRAVVTRLGHAVMDEIARVTEVTPGALTAIALLSDGRRAVPHEALVDRCAMLLSVLSSKGARIHPRLLSNGELRSAAVSEAMQLYLDAGFAEAAEPDAEIHVTTAGPRLLYCIQEDKRAQLDSTKNHIVHFFVDRALVAVALLMGPMPAPEAEVLKRARELSLLFAHEFRLDSPLRDAHAIEEAVFELVAEGTLGRDGELLDVGSTGPDSSALPALFTYRAILQTFLEGYLIAARGLRALLKGPLTTRELHKRTATLGERMYLNDSIRLREAISKPLFENALLAFYDEGYISRKGNEVSLPPSLRDERSIAAVAGRLRSYLEIHQSHIRHRPVSVSSRL